MHIACLPLLDSTVWHSQVLSCPLITQGHALKLIQQSAPVVGQHLCVLDSLAGPVLVPAADVVYRILENDEFVADAVLYKDGTVVLVDNGLLVLILKLVTHPRRCGRGVDLP